MTIAQRAQQAAEEVSWDVHGLHFAGLAWGDPSAKPVLALHGWLDNAASFSVLAPLLRDYYVVAPDLSGHGHSSHRADHAGYQIWEDLPEIDAITRQMGWEKFDLIGHSRGAVIATLFASARPDSVKHLVLLDGISPEPVQADQFPVQLARALDDKARLLGTGNRVYERSELAIAARERRGLGAIAAQLMCERNLRAVADGVSWRTDPRLHGASAVKMSPDQIEAVLCALTMPTSLLLAADGDENGRRWMADMARAHIANVQVSTVVGGHHFHLEEGAAEAAAHIQKFMRK